MTRASRHGLAVVSAVSTALHPFSNFFQLNIKNIQEKLGLPLKERFFKVSNLTNAFTFELDLKWSR